MHRCERLNVSFEFARVIASLEACERVLGSVH